LFYTQGKSRSIRVNQEGDAHHLHHQAVAVVTPLQARALLGEKIGNTKIKSEDDPIHQLSILA
jgi:hypothetical protein